MGGWAFINQLPAVEFFRQEKQEAVGIGSKPD